MKSNVFDFDLKLTQIGNRAINKAQEENRQFGLPNVYANHKNLYYELADGTITMKNPLKKSK